MAMYALGMRDTAPVVHVSIPTGMTACNTGIGPRAQAPALMTGWTQEPIDGCLPSISISVVLL
jgi:hypothetical protein